MRQRIGKERIAHRDAHSYVHSAYPYLRRRISFSLQATLYPALSRGCLFKRGIYISVRTFIPQMDLVALFPMMQDATRRASTEWIAMNLKSESSRLSASLENATGRLRVVLMR